MVIKDMIYLRRKNYFKHKYHIQSVNEWFPIMVEITLGVIFLSVLSHAFIKNLVYINVEA